MNSLWEKNIKNWPIKDKKKTAGEDTEAGQRINKKVNWGKDVKQPKLDYFFFLQGERELMKLSFGNYQWAFSNPICIDFSRK